MHLIIKEKNKVRINHIIDWLLYMVGYTLVFILVTSLFKSIHIDKDHLILWSFIIVLIIYLLNKTVKPILVTLTIPITGITLPFISYGGSSLLSYMIIIGFILNISNKER